MNSEAELIQEAFDRTYDLYTIQLRTFRRTLYTLIVAGLAVFGLLVVPFLTLSHQVRDKRISQSELAGALLEVQARLTSARADAIEPPDLAAALAQAASIFSHDSRYLARQIEATNHHTEILQAQKRTLAENPNAGLEDWIEGRAAVPSVDPPLYVLRNLGLQSVDECTWRSGPDHLRCLICSDFSRVAAALDAEVATILEPHELEDDWTGLFRQEAAQRCNAVAIQLRLQSLDDLQPHQRRNLSHLTTGRQSGNGGFATRLEALLPNVGDHLQTRVGVISQQVEAQRQAMEKEEAELAALSSQLERVQNFNFIGTPVGNVPVGMGQLVLLFPVVLAMAMAMLASSYDRVRTLRGEFERLSRRRDKDGAVMDRTHIFVVAPLWLDRADPSAARLAKGTILLVPALVFSANLYLIWATDALDNPLETDASINRGVYYGLYALSALLCVGNLIQLFRGARIPTNQ